ncbi:hypothetical protein J7E80_05030 [Arthrobacter sp. ISL-28]|nr:hypothetical protein [Arthrobacter sp. ISL-28]
MASSEAKSAGSSPRILKTVDSLAAVPAEIPSAVTTPARGSAPAPPARSTAAGPSPAPAAAPAVLSPIVGGIAAPVEAAAGALPSAEVIPPDTLTRVASPVVEPADAAVGRVAGGLATTVVQPGTETAPALDQPLEAVSDVLAATPFFTTPALTPAAEILNDLGPAPVTTAVPAVPSARATDSVDTAAPSVAVMAASAGGMPAVLSAIAGASSRLGGWVLPATILGGPRGPFDGGAHSPDAPLPAPPSGLGSGGGQSVGGPSQSAAWLSSPLEYVPPAGALPVTGQLQHAPSPVAFDPGSSPD